MPPAIPKPPKAPKSAGTIVPGAASWFRPINLPPVELRLRMRGKNGTERPSRDLGRLDFSVAQDLTLNGVQFRVLTGKQIATLLGLTQGTVWSWVKEGYFPPHLSTITQLRGRPSKVWCVGQVRAVAKIVSYFYDHGYSSVPWGTYPEAVSMLLAGADIGRQQDEIAGDTRGVITASKVAPVGNSVVRRIPQPPRRRPPSA